MINRYYAIIQDNTQRILGIKKYRGLADVPTDKLFVPAEPGTTLKEIPDREYFKLYNFDDFADQTLIQDFEISEKPIAFWNDKTNQITFTPVVRCESEIQHTVDKSIFTSIFFQEAKNIYTLPFESVSAHTINITLRNVELTVETNFLTLDSVATVEFLVGEGSEFKPLPPQPVDISHGFGKIIVPRHSTPGIVIAKISHPSFIVSNPLLYFEYK